MFPTIHGILSQVGLSFLLRDDFTTPEAAPIASPRTAEPGPGAATVVDTGSVVSISAGRLVTGTTGAPAWGSTGLVYGGFSRAAGMALMAQYNPTTSTAAGFGWNPAATVPDIATNNHAYRQSVVGSVYAGATAINAFPIAFATDYNLAITLRSAGGFYLSRLTAGTDWTLQWVDNAQTGATLYPFYTSFDGSFSSDFIRVAQLSAPFNTDNGIATDVHAGNVTTGTTFTHEADCLIEWTQTTLSLSLDTQVWFRITDPANRWHINVTSSGTIVLYERVAGSSTNRGAASGVIVNGSRIVIVCDDETINVYSDNTLRITYGTAITGKISTSGSAEVIATGAAIADLISWPRVLSGAAKSALDQMAA